MEVLSGDFLCSMILNASPSPVNGQAQLSGKTMAFGEGIKKLNAGKKDKQSEKNSHFLSGIWNAVSGS